jgi:NaMN:DMB phosphoribosyltransferase
MDRIGLKGAPDLAITVEHSISPSETIAKKLASIALRLTPPAEPEDLGEVEDADIIDEPQEAPLESASTNK